MISAIENQVSNLTSNQDFFNAPAAQCFVALAFTAITGLVIARLLMYNSSRNNLHSRQVDVELKEFNQKSHIETKKTTEFDKDVKRAQTHPGHFMSIDERFR